MGDYQFWLYIIIGAIYLLSRFLKKSAPNPNDVPEARNEKPATRLDPSTTTQKPSPPKMVTFEDLLREITESKKPAAPQQPSKEYTNYDEELEDEEQDLEDVEYNYNRDKISSEYEDAKQHAFLRPSLEETMNIKDTDTRFEKFKVFDQDTQSNVMDRYLTDFSDFEGLKKAIVMSEILQRKF
jgi:predicted DNA binding CopG/RHH family protein